MLSICGTTIATKVLNDVYEKHVHKICIKKIVDELKESEDSDLKNKFEDKIYIFEFIFITLTH